MITLEDLMGAIERDKTLTKNGKLRRELEKLFENVYWENEFVQHEGYPDTAPSAFTQTLIRIKNKIIKETN